MTTYILIYIYLFALNLNFSTSGEFGVVQKGHYYECGSDTPKVVAMKSLKGIINVLIFMLNFAYITETSKIANHFHSITFYTLTHNCMCF